MTTVREDDVDGVRTFWVDTGRPVLHAALVFRAGMVDETLPTTGWLHLAEHLALHDRDEGTLHVDGSVSLHTTRLVAHGEPAQVATALTEICAWLSDPVLDRLAEESRVLRAESEYRGTGDAAGAMLQRFGARGPGLAGYTEPGLHRATADGVRELVARVLTRGNAALVLDGPPPQGLRLPLPAGERVPLPPAPRADDPRPAAYTTPGRLVLSGEVPRTAAATFLPVVVQDMLRRDLRETAGGAYAPWSSYEGADADTAVVLAGSDVAESLLPSVVHYATSGLATLRARGPIAGVVEHAVAVTLQQMRDPYAAAAFADRAAVSHLLGRERQTPEELADEVAAVTADDVAALVPQFAETLLLGVPGGATWRDELPMLRMPLHEAPSAGTRFRFRNFPASREQLVVSDHAVEVGEKSAWQRLQLDEVAGVFAAADGGRTLIGADGWSLSVEPTMWRNGPDAVRRLDALLPPDRFIPFPAREAQRIPQPLPWHRRWGAQLIVLLMVVLGVVLMGAGAVMGRIVVIGGGAFVLYSAYKLLRDQRNEGT